MGTIQIKKVEKTVVTGKQGEARQKVKKTTWKTVVQVVITILTAIATSLGTASCMR